MNEDKYTSFHFCPNCHNKYTDKTCPKCGEKTLPYRSNDGFKDNGPQQNKIYKYPYTNKIIDPNNYPFTEEFIRPYNERYFLKGESGSLPKNFHYNGMHKIKAGKGYRNGIPIGIVSETECEECQGRIISIQMNTSSKGFETTSEKVCEDCGLVYQGAFTVLNRYDDNYKGRQYDTHEAWLKDMQPSFDMDDVSAENEAYEHVTGHRPLDDMDDLGAFVSHTGVSSIEYNMESRKELAKALGLNNINSEHWNRDKEGMEDWRKRQYYNQVDICKSMLGMNNYQVNEVKYIIDNHGIEYKRQRGTYSYEDVISHMCLFVVSKSMKPQRFSVYIREFKRCNRYNKTLYMAIRDKLNV